MALVVGAAPNAPQLPVAAAAASCTWLASGLDAGINPPLPWVEDPGPGVGCCGTVWGLPEQGGVTGSGAGAPRGGGRVGMGVKLCAACFVAGVGGAANRAAAGVDTLATKLSSSAAEAIPMNTTQPKPAHPAV